MVPSELLRRLADCLNRLGAPYLITGSMASGAYGEPRLTNDIDVVAQLGPNHVSAIVMAFPPPDYYCSREAIVEAIRNRFQFNILHLTTGMKIDVIVTTDSEFDATRLRRVRTIQTADTNVRFASPEDVILKKLVYFREGGSEKHLRDIVGILKVQAELIEFDYLAEWVARLGVADEWQLVMSRMPSSAK